MNMTLHQRLQQDNIMEFRIFDIVRDHFIKGHWLSAEDRNDLSTYTCPEGDVIPSLEEVEAKIEELKAKEPMKVLRFKRDRLLAESDWTQMPDVENELKEKWKEYRQALRDLPSKSEPKLEHNELLNVEFPQKPEQLNGD